MARRLPHRFSLLTFGVAGNPTENISKEACCGFARDYTSRISKRWIRPFCIWNTWITTLSARRLPFGSRTT